MTSTSLGTTDVVRDRLAKRLIGTDTVVPCLGGRSRRFVNLDYAASTPVMAAVWDAVEAFLRWCSGVHRGSGVKSRISTAFEDARASVGEFVGGRDHDAVVFVRNTTEAINVLSAALPEGTRVVSSAVEHHPEPHSVTKPAPWGMLAAIDLHGCERRRLEDPNTIRRVVPSVIEAIGMRAHGPLRLERFGDGELEGWSAMQFIETSSITVHADEVSGRCFLDVFSCRAFDPELATAIAVVHFGGTPTLRVLER